MPWRGDRLLTPLYLLGEFSWTEEIDGLQSMGLQRVRQDWMTKHSTKLQETLQYWFWRWRELPSKERRWPWGPPCAPGSCQQRVSSSCISKELNSTKIWMSLVADSSTKPPERNAPRFQPVFPWLENPIMLYIDSWSPESSIEYWKIVLRSWICGNLSPSKTVSTHSPPLFHVSSLGRLCCCCCSVAKSCPTLVTPWTVACQAPLSFIISWSLLKFMPIEWVMPSNHLILCRPSPPVFSLSQHQGLFQWVGSLNQVAAILELQMSPSKEHSRFISFRIDWVDLLGRLRHVNIISGIIWPNSGFDQSRPTSRDLGITENDGRYYIQNPWNIHPASI